MAILVTPETSVLVQGITGGFGARHTQLSLDYGTQIVAGVTPGKGGQLFENKVPIFDTVAEAVQRNRRHRLGRSSCRRRLPPMPSWKAWTPGWTWWSASPRAFPSTTWSKSNAPWRASNTRLIGPNCPGIVTPGEGKDSHGGCRIGISPGYIHKQGPHRGGFPQRHADLRGRLATDLPRRRPVHLRRHRRRPRQWHLPPGRDQDV